MKTARNYPLLLASQFWSAFGDNFILVLILGPILTDFHNGKINAQSQSLANIYYTSLLFIPYVLFAPIAGFLNDRYAKSRWLMGGNLIKLIGAGITACGLFAGSIWLAAGYFVVGIGSCLYSPAKYGILPEILPAERLVKANGTMEFLTLIAILSAGIAGGEAFDTLPLAACYAIAMAIYAISLALNLCMSPTPDYPQISFRHSLSGFLENIVALLSQKRLARILMGTSLFWICGAIIKMNFQPWGQQVLQLASMTQISLLGLWLGIGLMVGSVLAGQLYAVGELRATRRNGWILAAAVAALASVGWLLRHGLDYPHTLSISILIVTGLVAGLFLIPLNAALQAESHQDKLGKTIATQNGFENLAMLGGSLLAFFQVKFGFNPSDLLAALAIFVTLVVFALKIPAKK